MISSIALLVWIVGVAGLFYLDRDDSVPTSKALWLPVIWIAIVGSRSLSNWFGMAAPAGTDPQLDGTQPDRIVFQILVIASVAVLFFRAKQTGTFLKASWPIS